jgi:hypothetical protein
MMPRTQPWAPLPGLREMPMEDAELRQLFHKLNNQLGIILSHGELLELKSTDASNKSRATQVVSGALEALATTRLIRAKAIPNEQ